MLRNNVYKNLGAHLAMSVEIFMSLLGSQFRFKWIYLERVRHFQLPNGWYCYWFLDLSNTLMQQETIVLLQLSFLWTSFRLTTFQRHLQTTERLWICAYEMPMERLRWLPPQLCQGRNCMFTYAVIFSRISAPTRKSYPSRGPHHSLGGWLESDGFGKANKWF